MFPGASRRVHPLIGLLLVAWSIASLYLGFMTPVLLVGLVLSIYSRTLHRLWILLLWITIPVILILSLYTSILNAVISGLKLLSLVIVATSTLSLLNPTELAYTLSRLGIPPSISYLIPFTFRMIGYLTMALDEARASLRGRGVKGGMGIILKLPIPLIIHSYNLSAYIAEALAFKAPNRSKTWVRRPTITPIDVVLAIYMVSCTLLELYRPLL